MRYEGHQPRADVECLGFDGTIELQSTEALRASLGLEVNLGQLTREERTAFFINIYNALVVHGMTLFGPATTTLKRYAHPL